MPILPYEVGWVIPAVNIDNIIDQIKVTGVDGDYDVLGEPAISVQVGGSLGICCADICVCPIEMVVFWQRVALGSVVLHDPVDSLNDLNRRIIRRTRYVNRGGVRILCWRL